MAADVLILGAGIVGLAVADVCPGPGAASSSSSATGAASKDVVAQLRRPARRAVLRAGHLEGPALRAQPPRHGGLLRPTPRRLPAARKTHRRHRGRRGPALEALLKRGEQNGVEGLAMLTSAQVRLLEPDVTAVAALASEASGVIDIAAFAQALEACARRVGVDFAFRHHVARLTPTAQGLRVTATGPQGEDVTLTARHVINCAGLQADAVLRRSGVDTGPPGLTQRFARGSWFRLTQPRRLQHLIYPVPPPQLSGLGLHVTVDVDGVVRLGPDVEWVGPDAFLVVDEARAELFAESARRYLPWVQASMLEPDQAGLRAKLSGPGEPPGDFVLADEAQHGLPGLLSFAGIESPGLTCALGLADEVAKRLA